MKQNDRIILDSTQFDLTIKRLAYQLIENHNDFSNTIIIGLQPRGTFLADRVVAELKAIDSAYNVQSGALDVTFHRDDYRRQGTPLVPSKTEMNFDIEEKNVILVDDVLFTGRTIRAGLDAMLTFGRPIPKLFKVKITTGELLKLSCQFSRRVAEIDQKPLASFP